MNMKAKRSTDSLQIFEIIRQLKRKTHIKNKKTTTNKTHHNTGGADPGASAHDPHHDPHHGFQNVSGSSHARLYYLFRDHHTHGCIICFEIITSMCVLFVCFEIITPAIEVQNCENQDALVIFESPL